MLAEARSCASGSLMVGTLRWCQYESFADLRCDADTEWCVFVWVQVGEKIALSRRVDKHWRLIGWGQINRGKRIEPDETK